MVSRKQLERYIRKLADILDLKDWEIRLSDEPPIEDAQAMVWSPNGRRLAEIRIAYDWQLWTPEKLRHTITHELLHLHWTQPWDYIRVHASDDLFDAFRWQAEYSIDSVAVAVSRFLPLIRGAK